MGVAQSSESAVVADPPIACPGDLVHIKCRVANRQLNMRYFLKVAKPSDPLNLVFNQELRAPEEIVLLSCPFNAQNTLALVIEGYKETEPGSSVIASGSLVIRETPHVHQLPTITTGGVTLSLASYPFFGFRQTVAFAREGGAGSWDYIEFHDDEGRISWEWCSKADRSGISVGTAKNNPQGSIKYFRDGNYVSQGTLLAELKFEMHSPIKRFLVVPPTAQVRTKVSVDCDYEINPKSNYVLELRVDDVTLQKVVVPGQGIAKNILVDLPILAGWCEIACVTENVVCASHHMFVTEDPYRPLPPSKIRFVGTSENSVTVSVNENVHVSHFGTPEAHVLLVKSVQLGNSARPKKRAVPTKSVVKKLGKCASLETASVVSIPEAGTYFVILGIEYSCGYQIVDALKIKVEEQNSKQPSEKPKKNFAAELTKTYSPTSTPFTNSATYGSSITSPHSFSNSVPTSYPAHTSPTFPSYPPSPIPSLSSPLPPPSAVPYPLPLPSAPPLEPAHPSAHPSASPQENQGNVMCVVCWENPRNVVVFPCKHLCLCENCSVNLQKCPICNQPLSHTEKFFV